MLTLSVNTYIFFTELKNQLTDW